MLCNTVDVAYAEVWGINAGLWEIDAKILGKDVALYELDSEVWGIYALYNKQMLYYENRCLIVINWCWSMRNRVWTIIYAEIWGIAAGQKKNIC